MTLHIDCVQEDSPGQKWQALFNKAWPHYKAWFLSDLLAERKGYTTSVKMLEYYMPELLPVYEKLTELAGGGDLEARFLSMYCPPKYLAGCSQMALAGEQNFLIRNYDYNPHLFEGNMLSTNWLKPVIGMSDCLWGLLDGMNGDGLAASLAFGGSNITGEGFGIPLLIRYVLETTSTVGEALAVLYKVPVHMAYNVTLADAAGGSATIYLAPGKTPVEAVLPLASNHQEIIDWPQYAALTGTLVRKNVLENIHFNPAETEASILQKFFHPPLFNYNYIKSFGTLYTIIYHTSGRQVKLYLPEKKTVLQSFEDFKEQHFKLHLPDAVSPS